MTLSELRQRTENYDEDMYLGRLTWYTISGDSHVDHGEFSRVLLESGLDSGLPAVPRNGDVFKRACTAAQRSDRIVENDEKVQVNYMIRHLRADTEEIIRRLVGEKVNAEGLTLSYCELANLTFSRDTSFIHIERLNYEEHPGFARVDDVLATVKQLYNTWNNALTPYAIREFVRKLIRDMNATVLRDGVYFVAESNAEIVGILESIVTDFVGHGSFMHSLPLIDDRKQREMLKKSFEDESINEIDRLLGEMGELLGDKTQAISSTKFANYKVEYDRLRTKIAEYSDLLDTAMETTAGRLELMDTVLFELMGRVEV